jgi:hypothetical protein
MTGSQALTTAEQQGVRVMLIGPDRLRVKGACTSDFRSLLAQHKAEIVAELRAPAYWPLPRSACGFLIGHAGDDCKRCAAPWSEHYRTAGSEASK